MQKSQEREPPQDLVQGSSSILHSPSSFFPPPSSLFFQPALLNSAKRLQVQNTEEEKAILGVLKKALSLRAGSWQGGALAGTQAGQGRQRSWRHIPALFSES